MTQPSHRAGQDSIANGPSDAEKAGCRWLCSCDHGLFRAQNPESSGALEDMGFPLHQCLNVAPVLGLASRRWNHRPENRPRN